jgi:hypothetical protein
MTRWLSAVCVVAGCVALAPALGAQWPSYPTPGVPRTADGKPVLDAPTPRLPDGKVDFSGIWQLPGFGGGGAGGAGRGGRGAAPAASQFSQGPPVSQFFEVGGRGNPLPLQPWAAELKKKRMADNSKDNPDVWCLPIGLMQYHNHPQPRQIVQTKNLMLITYEANYGLRYIYLDGRQAPNNDPSPWWFGYSRGWYEGNDTLVETTNFLGEERAGWLDVNGSPYTDALKMTERFRRPNFGTLEIDVTIDDPKAYTKPFSVRVNHRIMVDEEMIEFICNENEKSTHHIDPPDWTKKPAEKK